MKRKTLINLHLYFSATASFLLLLFMITGSLHDLGFKETEVKEVVTTKVVEHSMDKKEFKSFFIKTLKEVDSEYSYDYIKSYGNRIISRPTTRDYYSLEKKEGSTLILTHHKPSLRYRLMEFHKGHGSMLSKRITGVIGLIFTLSIVTGIFLGLGVKSYKKITIISFLTGTVLVVLLFVS